MTALFPISGGRISDLLLRNRLSAQFEADRQALVNLQDQISTGVRLSKPSDDSPAALRAISVQTLLEQKDQIRTNLDISQSFLAATDTTLASLSSRLADIRAQSLSAVDSTTSEQQRNALVQEIRQTIGDFAGVGNRQFRGRFLFAGSTSAVKPFELVDDNVVYLGNQESLSSYVDVDLLVPTNVTGDQVFGAISSEVRGSTQLTPVLTSSTLLSSLRGGEGIQKGSFVVSDGNSSNIVDISDAETIGDVIRLIESNPPAGRTVVVRPSGFGLTVDLDDAGGGTLTIRDAPEGTAAQELGIENETGVGVAPLVGSSTVPSLTKSTPLADLLGTRASAVISSPNPNAAFVVEAVDNGAAFNDVTIRFVEVAAAGDQAFASFDAGASELVIDINEGSTTANTVVAAINATGVFSAQLDTKQLTTSDGTGFVALASTATTAGGAGIVFDQSSGIQVVNGGTTHSISFADAETVEDLLNILNGSQAGLIAEINQAANGINVRSRLSGSDFQIGENGGTTAAELGIRTFTLDTRLESLNFGNGVHVAEGTDFEIRRKDGVELAVDVSSATTVGDVISLINAHPDNVGSAVEARLAEFGNGIELLDANSAAPETLTVTRALSVAAWDLGFVERGADTSAATPATFATAQLFSTPSSPPNTSIELTASQSGPTLSEVEIEFVDARTGDVADAVFDPLAKRLTINVDAALTTANTVIGAVNSEGTFAAALHFTSDQLNDGTGVVGATGVVGTTSGGLDETIEGSDVNPLETKGVFNSLIRLSHALEEFDLVEIQRTVAMLDDDFSRLSFARAEVGARARGLNAVERRLEDENVELRTVLSEEIDTDVVQVISDLTARQAGMQATLQLIGRVLQLTVLDFL